MRLANIRRRTDGRCYLAVVRSDSVELLEEGDNLLLNHAMRGQLVPERFESSARRSLGTLPLNDVEFLPPVTSPPAFRDFMGFETHIKNCVSHEGRKVPPIWYDQPVFYFSNPHVFQSSSAPVRRPEATSMLDFELEVAAIVHHGGSDLSLDDAEHAIAGYFLISDWSLRDTQEDERAIFLGPVKAKDAATSAGPWLVTANEMRSSALGKGFALDVSVQVNGVEFMSSTLQDMHWSFAEMIAFASRDSVVRPGDVFGSGTVGNGCILERVGRDASSDLWLDVDDHVCLSIDGLGSIDIAIS